MTDDKLDHNSNSQKTNMLSLGANYGMSVGITFKK